VAKTAGNSLGIPADFFSQENPQVKSRFLVVQGEGESNMLSSLPSAMI
jgi:hypothetical protein